MNNAASLLLRLGGCCLIAWAAWRYLGLLSLVTLLPIFGVALAKPLVDLASDIRHALRAPVWRADEGRYYAFRGVPVEVIEAADLQRWVRLADVRRILGPTASDGALALSYPDGLARLGRSGLPYLSDEALLAHLAKERSPEAGRFRVWVEREIVFAARREREHAGMAIAPAGAGDGQRRMRSTSAVVE